MLELAGRKFVLSETVDDDVVIFDKANVEIHGIINGNVHALHGTNLIIKSTGIVNGCIVASDAPTTPEPGAKIRKGFSQYKEHTEELLTFAGCTIDTDNDALEKAIKEHATLIAKYSQNHA